MSMSDNDDNSKLGIAGVGADGRPKTRSTSLKAALAALEGGADKYTPAGPASADEPSNELPQQKLQTQQQEDEVNVSANEHSPEGGRPKTKIFSGSGEELKYHQEPVVGWLVVVGGPGLGAFRPIFMGSNTLGADPGQRIPIDFGDEYISKEEQAYIRYDPDDRQFLFIPNLAKTNVVSIDGVKPTSAVQMSPYDMIEMGKTRLAFIPFCSEEFDWSDLPGDKS